MTQAPLKSAFGIAAANKQADRRIPAAPNNLVFISCLLLLGFVFFRG
jgi:hypothetical protein